MTRDTQAPRPNKRGEAAISPARRASQAAKTREGMPAKVPLKVVGLPREPTAGSGGARTSPESRRKMAPPAVGWDESAMLAEQAKKAKKALREGTKRYLEAIRDVGDILLRAKALLVHGKYEAWVNEGCGFSTRSATNYVLVAQNWEGVNRELAANRQRAADLSLRAFLALLTKTPGERDRTRNGAKRRPP